MADTCEDGAGGCSTSGAGLKARHESRDMTRCGKCKTTEIVVATQNEPKCRACFLDDIEHNVRKGLATPAIVNNTEKITVALSGGISSRALLHILHSHRDVTNSRRKFYRLRAVYVDESSAVPGSGALSVSSELLDDVKSKYGIEVAIVPIEDVFAADCKEAGERKERMAALMQSCRSQDAKEDVLEFLRMQVLTQEAAAWGSTKLAIGTNGSRMAVQVLAETCKGRGASLSSRLARSSFSPRFRDLRVLHPMKDVLHKDAALYCRFRGLTTMHVPNLSTKASTRASIGRLVEDFVATLQAGFPSTTHAILKTSSKWKIPSDLAARSTLNLARNASPDCEDLDPAHYCLLCAGKLDESSDAEQPWEHLFAKGGAPEWMRGRVCYGCRNVVNEVSDPALVPGQLQELFQQVSADAGNDTPWPLAIEEDLTQARQKRATREQMRAEIEDCLLGNEFGADE